MKSKFIYGILIGLTFGAVLQVYALEIQGVDIAEVTPNSATIKWKTDVPTDATINYGLDSAVGLVRDPKFDKKDHTLTIENLDPSTTYHFRVVSTDEAGNKSATAGFVFTTQNANKTDSTEQVKDTDTKVLAERIIAQIDQITDPNAIIAIAKQVRKVAGEVIKAPAIIGAPKVIANASGAEVIWTTDKDSNSMVYLVPEKDYFEGGGLDSYAIQQGDPSEFSRRHSVNVIGLDSATTYHFKVVSEDATGLRGETEDDTFKTKSLLPEVKNVTVTRVQEHSAQINWATPGVLAKGIVEYTNLRTKVSKTAGNAVFSVNQTLVLSGLEFGTRYAGTVVATNEAGETAKSEPFTFVTVRDLVAPQISKVNNESTLFPGEDTKIQTIVSYVTDEPASCQVFYAQGLAQGGSANAESLEAEQNPTAVHTQVIVGFAPATVYQFWVVCRDESGNETRSEDFVLITPIKEKNIIDIILENFQGTFGWVNNIGK